MAKPSHIDEAALHQQVVDELASKDLQVLAIASGSGDRGSSGVLCATDRAVWFYGFFRNRKTKQWSAGWVWGIDYRDIGDVFVRGNAKRGFSLWVQRSGGTHRVTGLAGRQAEHAIAIIVDKTSYGFVDIDGQTKALGGPEDVVSLLPRFTRATIPPQGPPDPERAALLDRYAQGLNLWEGPDAPRADDVLAAGPILLTSGNLGAFGLFEGEALLTTNELVVWRRPHSNTSVVLVVRAPHRNVTRWAPRPGRGASTSLTLSSVLVLDTSDTSPIARNDVAVDVHATLARGVHWENSRSLELIGTHRAVLARESMSPMRR